jgi:hypothetical protein
MTDTIIRRVATTMSLVLVVVVAATTAQVFWPRLSAAVGVVPAPPPPAYRAGETIDTPAEWHTGSPFTLVLFAQASCGACQRAEPYLRDLVAHLNGRARVVMASPGNDHEYDLQYGRAIGLEDSDVQLVPGRTRVKATPTLVVVNQRGGILGAWEGVGPEERHAELTAAIDRLLSS